MATCKLGKGASASVFMVASLPERAKKPEAKGPFALRQVKIRGSKKREAILTEIKLYNQIAERKIPGFATLVYCSNRTHSNIALQNFPGFAGSTAVDDQAII